MQKRNIERHLVRPGLWIELPKNTGKREVKARIASFIARLEAKSYVFNPKATN